jgi:hypothetical protein
LQSIHLLFVRPLLALVPCDGCTPSIISSGSSSSSSSLFQINFWLSSASGRNWRRRRRRRRLGGCRLREEEFLDLDIQAELLQREPAEVDVLRH